MDAVVRYTINQQGNEQVRSVNAIIGETNDGGLNDIRGLHVTTDHVLDAIRRAATGPVAEGSVGAGTGTICYGWKGGIGTSSRRVPLNSNPGAPSYTVGVLAQTNFGGNLMISGVPVFKFLQPPGRRAANSPAAGDVAYPRAGNSAEGVRGDDADGSCMSTSQLALSHANGTVKAKAVKSFDAPAEKTPAAAPAKTSTAKKK